MKECHRGLNTYNSFLIAKEKKIYKTKWFTSIISVDGKTRYKNSYQSMILS